MPRLPKDANFEDDDDLDRQELQDQLESLGHDVEVLRATLKTAVASIEDLRGEFDNYKDEFDTLAHEIDILVAEAESECDEEISGYRRRIV